MNQSRTRARRAAVQALYQWQMTAQTPFDIEPQFRDQDQLSERQFGHFSELLHGVTKQQLTVDEALKAFIDRDIDQIDPVERAILRLGGYELLYCPEVPYQVVINEAINLAKRFGAAESYRYINGILDKLAKQRRTAEANQSQSASRVSSAPKG